MDLSLPTAHDLEELRFLLRSVNFGGVDLEQALGALLLTVGAARTLVFAGRLLGHTLSAAWGGAASCVRRLRGAPDPLMKSVLDSLADPNAQWEQNTGLLLAGQLTVRSHFDHLGSPPEPFLVAFGDRNLLPDLTPRERRLVTARVREAARRCKERDRLASRKKSAELVAGNDTVELA